MGLCEVCRKIDIRELLQTAASLEHIKGHVNEENQCPCCILHEYGIPHHDSYAELKTAAGHGCEFCRLIGHSIIEEERSKGGSKDILQEEKKWNSHPVIIVPWKSGVRSSRSGEPPRIEIRVEWRSTSDDFISLLFEATAPRGKFPLMHTGLCIRRFTRILQNPAVWSKQQSGCRPVLNVTLGARVPEGERSDLLPES
ncbi:hypothetical protein GJ744_001025 [Endocarpon pusillum]|uniref:Uncharacterized protein n=1 Tax=Endocarpon pusillum TaxID=364733 RepID=A0A8H7ACR8_9EURO|nr:hypothetical protein GJ744_001025 [Endocarpon pusillum]